MESNLAIGPHAETQRSAGRRQRRRGEIEVTYSRTLDVKEVDLIRHEFARIRIPTIASSHRLRDSA
jgi:hypothetical protein